MDVMGAEIPLRGGGHMDAVKGPCGRCGDEVEIVYADYPGREVLAEDRERLQAGEVRCATCRVVARSP